MALVTVTVGAYNSSAYIVETLDSIYNQTYNDLELIIKDDASTDNTVKICQDWIKKYGSRFSRSIIIAAKENMGPPANFNKGIRAATGKFIKPIAGDDALMPNCIADNMDYLNNNPEIKVLYSFNRVYRNELIEESFTGLNPGVLPINIISADISANMQYKLLLTGDKIPFAPSMFFEREAVLDAGLPDEDLRYEHYQLLLKLTKKGYKLYFMDKETVLYRKHDSAINNTIKEFIIKPVYFKTEDLRKRYVYSNIPLDLRLNYRFSWIVNQIFRIGFFNKKNRLNDFLHYTLNVVLNPINFIIRIKSKFIPKYRDDVFYKE